MTCAHVFHDYSIGTYAATEGIPITQLPCPTCKHTAVDMARLAAAAEPGRHVDTGSSSSGSSVDMVVIDGHGDGSGGDGGHGDGEGSEDDGTGSGGRAGAAVPHAMPKPKAKSKAKAKANARGEPFSVDTDDGYGRRWRPRRWR